MTRVTGMAGMTRTSEMYMKAKNDRGGYFSMGAFQ